MNFFWPFQYLCHEARGLIASSDEEFAISFSDVSVEKVCCPCRGESLTDGKCVFEGSPKCAGTVSQLYGGAATSL